MLFIIIVVAAAPIAYMLIAARISRYKLENNDYYAKTDVVIQQHLKHFEYVQNLSPEAKIRFIKRLRYVASYMQFIGKKGLKVTDEMRVKISASLIQMTFGLDEFKLFGYRRIEIYPDVFFHRLVGKKVKGLAGHGLISLSWSHFIQGYADNDDNYNLGLHEVAHAMHLSASGMVEGNEIFGHLFDFWSKETEKEFQKISKKRSGFLRDYAATNKHEFFAVVVEHFFESPEKFNQHMPELYKQTVLLLNQDPIEKHRDYIPKLSPKDGEILNKRFEKVPSKINRGHYDVHLIMFGLFIGSIIVFGYTDNWALHWIDKVVALLLITIPILTRFNRFKANGRFQHFITFFLFAIFGLAMNVVAGLILLNHALPAKCHTERHQIVGHHYDKNSNRVYELEGNAYGRHENIRMFKHYPREAEFVEFYICKGVLGIPERHDAKVVSRKD